MDKSLGTLLHFWGIFQFTQAHTSPHPTNNDRQVYPELFFLVSELQKVGGELQDNFEKNSLFYEGIQNDRKIWILRHFPKDFCP